MIENDTVMSCHFSFIVCAFYQSNFPSMPVLASFSPQRIFFISLPSSQCFWSVSAPSLLGSIQKLHRTCRLMDFAGVFAVSLWKLRPVTVFVSRSCRVCLFQSRFLILSCLYVPVRFPDPAVFACSSQVSWSCRVCMFQLCSPDPPVFAFSCRLCLFSNWSLINFKHWYFCLPSFAFGAILSIVIELILYGCRVFYSIPSFNPSPINVRHFVTLFCKPEFMITFILTKQLCFLPHVWEKNWLHDIQPLVSNTNAITEHLFALIKLRKYYLTCIKVSVKYVSMCLKRYLYVVYWLLCDDRDSWPATEGSKHSMWYTQDVHADTCLVNLNTRVLSEHRLPASVFWRKSCNVLHMEGIIHDYSSINRKRGWSRICGLTLPPDLYLLSLVFSASFLSILLPLISSPLIMYSSDSFQSCNTGNMLFLGLFWLVVELECLLKFVTCFVSLHLTDLRNAWCFWQFSSWFGF